MVRAKEAADSSAGRDPSGEGEDVTVDGAITGGMGRAGVSGRDGVVVRGGAIDDGAADGEKAGMEGSRGGEATE